MDKKGKKNSSESRPPSRDDRPGIAGTVRDLTSSGLAALLMTEDSIRSYLKEKNLPKELVGLFLDGVSKKKEDLYQIVASEIGKMFAKVDLGRELSRFMEGHKIKIEASISFQRKDESKEDSE